MTVMKYPGSKQSIANWIISHFPAGYECMTYLEPFFGSGCIFFAKNTSQIETINDIDNEIYNLFTQIRENTEQLIFMVENTEWSRNQYLLAFEKCDNPIEQARRFLVRAWFSIGSAYTNKSSIRMNIEKPTGGHELFHNKLPAKLKEISKRLKNDPGHYVQIENKDALILIQKYNRKNVLMYLDPPYVADTRVKNKIYQHEMNDDDHKQLLELITGLQANVLVSGYDNNLYNNYLEKWNKSLKISLDEAGNKRTECLWFNYNSRQFDLFNDGGSNGS
jgi:DNA adenine methylase